MPQLTPISVMDLHLDTLLRNISSQLPQFKQLGSFDELLSYLGELAPSGPRTLDLIDHHYHSGVIMKIGTWEIRGSDRAPSPEAARLKASGELARLDIRQVRLLGCATACTQGALATIQHYERTLGVPIVATRWPIDPNDFSNGEINAQDQGALLIDSPTLRRLGWRLPSDCISSDELAAVMTRPAAGMRSAIAALRATRAGHPSISPRR